MFIRKARADESKVIVPYILLAMEDIAYQFIGENSQEKITQMMENLVGRKSNQYSYENCWVVEDEDGMIIAAANIYDGARLYELREPVAREIKRMFNRDFNSEDETQAGEYYIDCIGVRPDQQGKGIGSKILQFLMDEYVRKEGKTIGLLVDKENPQAKKLYVKLGFEFAGEKTLAGKKMEHLQLNLKTASKERKMSDI